MVAGSFWTYTENVCWHTGWTFPQNHWYEHLLDVQGVTGSSPVSSTKKALEPQRF